MFPLSEWLIKHDYLLSWHVLNIKKGLYILEGIKIFSMIGYLPNELGTVLKKYEYT